MARYDLSDFEWSAIDAVLPRKSRGVPRVDDRRVLNGIFRVLRSGAPWADLPERYGPYTTCYNRFRRWTKAGIRDRIMDAVTDANGLPIRLAITSGETHDAVPAQELLSGLQKGQLILADRAYDAGWIRRQIEEQGATPNIPSKANRKWKACFSAVLYKDRNLVERFFNKLKCCRRIATRYDKLGSTFMAMIKLASIRIWLRTYETAA